jgi:acetyltransferase-like isoleucine patch superfamily enzyme
MRGHLKRAADGIMLAMVLLPWLLYRLESYFFGAENVFPGWSQAFSLVPGLFGVYLRRAFYRLVFPECGRDVCISFGTVFSHPTVRIGHKVYVGLFCVIGDVTLEDDVIVASRVSIANGPAQHGIDRLDVPIREQPGEWPRVTVGRDSWIGEGAVVLTDVGNHCVIGAAALVTRAVPAYAIAVGVPAKVVSSRLPPGLTEAMHSGEPTTQFSESFEPNT